MSEPKVVRTILMGVVICNLLVLIVVFAYPRLKYLAGHYEKPAAELRELPGVFDMPNQFQEFYRIVNIIDEALPQFSTVLFSDDNEWGMYRPIVLQMLLPRKVYFARESNFKKRLMEILEEPGLLVVYYPEKMPGLCRKPDLYSFNSGSVGICRLENILLPQ